MKIYTKTGDLGETGLRGGFRVRKNHSRVAAYGEIDELNCQIGIALSLLPENEELSSLKTTLERIQNDLFFLGAVVSDPQGAAKPPEPRIKDGTDFLEKDIDSMTEQLPELKNFILPGGSPAGAALHAARAACRRAERSLTALPTEELGPDVVVYANRLSDHLFTAARWTNFKLGRGETIWKSSP